jgi:plastocyanin
MTPTQRLPALGAALVLLASCGGPGPTGSEATPSTSASQPTSPAATAASPTGSMKPFVVHIRNNAYVPAAPVVIVGQSIEIINEDAEAHTWSAILGSGWSYTSDNLDPGQRATFSGFTKPGSYKFVCYYHGEMPSMNGTVTVKEATQHP